MATAPLRKCIRVVAGTPVIDSPYALVITSLPSTVTRTITAFRSCCFIWSSTMLSMAAASALGVAAVEVDALLDALSRSDDEHAAPKRARAATTANGVTKRVFMRRVSRAFRRNGPVLHRND